MSPGSSLHLQPPGASGRFTAAGGSCTFRSSGGNSRQLFFFFNIFLNVSSVQLLGETGGLMLEHVNLLVLHFSISRTVIFDWFNVISIKLLPGFNTAPFINES